MVSAAADRGPFCGGKLLIVHRFPPQNQTQTHSDEADTKVALPTVPSRRSGTRRGRDDGVCRRRPRPFLWRKSANSSPFSATERESQRRTWVTPPKEAMATAADDAQKPSLRRRWAPAP